jgi:DNA-binding IscR family transcriptional regulator
MQDVRNAIAGILDNTTLADVAKRVESVHTTLQEKEGDQV